MKQLLYFALLLLLVSQIAEGQYRGYRVNIIKDVFQFSDETKKSINLSDLNQSCPDIDCIPAIDTPSYIPVQQVDYVDDTDIVLVASYNGVTKIYPRNMMQAHEVVNDYFNDEPLAITYCPLCGSAVGLVPLIDGERVELGVAGLLHNSDLVLYDRKTRSLWGQITGRAIVGSKTGEQLKRVGVSVIRWQDAKIRFTEGLVLKIDKDSPQYKSFRFQNYVESDRLIFPVAIEDARLKRKTVVYGLDFKGKAIAYEENYLKKNSPVIESINGEKIKIQLDNDNSLKAINLKTGDDVSILRNYWFAWYSFYPDTELKMSED
ncbi:DUF3179 domain-containing protein [Alteromonadaceae bacterium M269]|nr:DUF3179 domain-containing protein [Alteromonadaceae bacterium M269]